MSMLMPGGSSSPWVTLSIDLPMDVGLSVKEQPSPPGRHNLVGGRVWAGYPPVRGPLPSRKDWPGGHQV